MTMRRTFTALLAWGLAALSLTAAPAALPSFPGAEGFGATTPGGRGGRVIAVTTLDDSGPGSFRAACEAAGPRIVVFRVSGTISLRRAITVSEPFLTIAGQTAPGDGICLRGYPFGIATHDVIVRYLRSRLGDETAKEADCIDLLHGARDCIIDHCSATWSIDECLSLSGEVSNCTIQWCIIGEALRQSKHKKGSHGYGSLSRANGPVSWHHNLWIHNDARNPRLGDNYGKPPYPTFDVRNNVIYDFGGTATGLTQGNLKVNYVANAILPGPDSKAKAPIVTGGKSDMQFYIRDNLLEGNEALSRDNARFFSAVEFEGRRQVNTVASPFAAPAVTTVAAADLTPFVLAGVGASRPVRDAVDARLVEHVRTRTGHMINSQKDVGGWPVLKAGPAPRDTDGDGIPDEWETSHGLNPRDPSDGAARRNPGGYTNVEEYLHSLAGQN